MNFFLVLLPAPEVHLFKGGWVELYQYNISSNIIYTLNTNNEGSWIECGYQNRSHHKHLNPDGGAARRPKDPGMVQDRRLSGGSNYLCNRLHR